MKIALCLSGQPRIVSTALHSLQSNLIEINECDVFIHTWCNNKHKERIEGDYRNEWSFNDYPILLQQLKPKSILIEEQFDFINTYKIPDWCCNCTAQNSQSMFYSIKQSNELKKQYEIKNNFEYDYVIRSRMDCWFRSSLDVSVFDKNHIHVSNTVHGLGFNDFFAIGNSKNMDKYSSTFDNLQHLSSVCEFNNELLLAENLKLNNVPVISYDAKRFLFPCVVRGNGKLIQN